MFRLAYSLVVIVNTWGCARPDFSLSIADNPGCDIAPIATWQTKEPATSWVDFADGDGRTLRVGSDEMVTEHALVLVGMRADETYTINAESVSESGASWTSQEAIHANASLPYAWLAPLVLKSRPSNMNPGWTVANIATGLFTDVTVVMLDEAGRVVWYYLPDEEGRADLEVTGFENSGVLIGPAVGEGEYVRAVDWTGEIVWQGPQQPEGLMGDGVMHHTLHEVGVMAGEFVTVSFIDADGDLGDRITRFDDELNEVWSWDSLDYLDTSAVEVLGPGSLTHINSVIFDEEAAYVNSWSLGQAYKVDLETGDLIWTLGEGGDFAADGAADTPWFSHAHSIEMVPEKEGSFLFYDNGPRSRGVSRVVEYTLDEQTMDAEITWEYPGDIAQDRWFNEAWGDVDSLENSNILVTAGNATMGDTQSRLFEVTREGMVVWEVVWGVNDGGDPMGSYAAERIPAVAVEL